MHRTFKNLVCDLRANKCKIETDRALPGVLSGMARASQSVSVTVMAQAAHGCRFHPLMPIVAQ